jgi:hypothetical protein
MSDELDRMFEGLRGRRPPQSFAVPEAIRRRGRQRTQHQVLAAGLAVVAVAGAGTGWAVNLGPVDPGPTPGATRSTAAPSPTPRVPSSPTPSAPSASPTAPATRTRTPVSTDLSALMLRVEDLGPGTWRRGNPYEPFSGDLWAWDLSAECPAYRTADYPSLRQQVDLAYASWETSPPATPFVGEHVHRYRPGWGPRTLDDVRRVLATCPGASPPPSIPGGPVPTRRTIVDTGFAGDESLLIRAEVWRYDGETIAKEPLANLIAVVRVGDLVATVFFSVDRDEQYARTVAEAAANRLAG